MDQRRPASGSDTRGTLCGCAHPSTSASVRCRFLPGVSAAFACSSRATAVSNSAMLSRPR
eukprot:scaffold215537_cov31-Tisochrysis_lutea.AAC.1